MANITGIYKITSPSGKVYIGQSWDMRKRWNEHRNQRALCRKVSASINKYGAKQHVFEVIHSLPKDVDQSVMDVYECLYISQYKAVGIEMLNIKEGGRGGKHSAESKRKMSESSKGFKHSAETKAKWSAARKGKIPEGASERMKKYNETRIFTEEIKEKIREGNKNKYLPGQHPNTGRKKSKETCDKISESRKGKYAGEKHPLYGKPRSEAVKEALRKANTGKKASEETKAKLSAMRRGSLHPSYGKKRSEESKEKMKIAALNRSAESKQNIINGNKKRLGKII